MPLPQRLQDEQEIWITTVRPDGQPQTSPVGYLWDGESFLILSQPNAPKVRNLRENPKVALHLDIDRDSDDDGGVITIEGTASIDPEPLSSAEAAAYETKFREAMASAGMTPAEVFAQFSAVIRITPTRTRVY
jgi:PPOX class probable F420-dependent enzyme